MNIGLPQALGTEEEYINNNLNKIDMKNKILGFTLLILLFGSCASIPKETVTLSKTIGADLQILHNSHRNMIQMYYQGIKSNINTFIDDVYSPFIIHYVLKDELEKYKTGESSLYGIIEIAGKVNGKEESEDALNVMLEFQKAAYNQIKAKRDELLNPIIHQEKEMLQVIDLSYQNTIYANSTLTAYLTSLRKIKESQNEVLSIIGMEGMDTSVTNTLVELSGIIGVALEKGGEIDIKSDEAYQQIEDIINKIKGLTNKVQK